MMKQQQRHSNNMGLPVSAQQLCIDGWRTLDSNTCQEKNDTILMDMKSQQWLSIAGHLCNNIWKTNLHASLDTNITYQSRGVRSCPRNSQWIWLSIHWWEQPANGWISCWCPWRSPRENGNISKNWSEPKHVKTSWIQATTYLWNWWWRSWKK